MLFVFLILQILVSALCDDVILLFTSIKDSELCFLSNSMIAALGLTLDALKNSSAMTKQFCAA